MPQYTIKEIAEMSGDEYGEIAGLMKILVRRGLAKECGNRPNPPGTRGKPSVEYELDGAFDFVLFDDSPEIPEATEETPEEAQTSVPSAENPEILVNP